MTKNAFAPLISVLIPVHNAERFVARAIRSVLNQTIPDRAHEVIVVNDASTDRTDWVLDLFADEIEIHHNEKKTGLPACLNRAIRAARGKYVVRVDADDYVTNDYLYILQRFLDENTYMDAVACDYFLVDESENIIERRNCMEHPIGCGIMFRTDHLIDIGMYDDDFLIHEDRDLRARFLKRYTIHHVQLPLYRYRRHKDNLTNDLGAAQYFEQRFKDKHNEEPA